MKPKKENKNTKDHKDNKDNKDNNDPFKKIFKLNKNGLCSEEISSIEDINLFFKYLKNEKIPQASKSKLIEEFISKIKNNRYLCEYFSTYENNSIYLFLFDLFLNPSTQQILKDSILNLIDELRINIEISKTVCDYIFQKLASLYRSNDITPEIVYNNLTLLSKILGETENCIKPRNYFCCIGNGKFDVDLRQKKIKVGTSFTIILNFKIGNFSSDVSLTSNLIKINFSNNYSIDFDLQYPVLLIVKEIRDSFIKTFPLEEWINLVINIVIDDRNKIFLYFYVNGENHLTSFKLKNTSFTKNDEISSMSFFNNFYGEVSSIILLSQPEEGKPGSNSTAFLQEFKLFKEGIYKKKRLDKFLILLKDIKSVVSEKKESTSEARKFTIPLDRRSVQIIEPKKLIDNLIFIFTPFNTSNINNKKVIDNVNSFLQMKYDGNICPHKYQCYQRKLELIGVIDNILPIADMFLIHPSILTENNFNILLEIIFNILNDRKKNMEHAINCKFFQILALFLEKFPEDLFTLKILDSFTKIGKCLYSANIDKLTSKYFKTILLNEKILSKYTDELQIQFWNQIMLFCQSDSSQIENSISLKRLSLILRFYDRNKYSEMCCVEHLNMIKEEYRESQTVMNPPMTKKLSYIENIMNAVINVQSPVNACSLFRLLTLDLSPCLMKFILKVFIGAFQKNTINEMWKNMFISELIKNKFDIILINALAHSLPDIRLDILQLVFEINSRLDSKNTNFQSLLKMVKFNLLPKDNFFNKKENATKTENKNDSNIKHTKNNIAKPDEKKVAFEKVTPAKNNNINSDKKMVIIKKPPARINTQNYNKINTLSKSVIVPKEDNKNIIQKNNNNNFNNNNNIHKNVNPPTSNKTANKFSNMINQLEHKLMHKKEENITKPSKNINTNDNNTTTQNQLNKSTIQSTSAKNISNNKNNVNDEKKHYGITHLKNSEGEILIFKDNIFYDYINDLYTLFIKQALNLTSNKSLDSLDVKKIQIGNSMSFELLLALVIELNELPFTIKCLQYIESLVQNPRNAYIIFSNEKIISSLLNLTFKNFKQNDEVSKTSYTRGKSIIINIINNSSLYVEKTQTVYPCDKIDSVFMWGDSLIQNEKSNRQIIESLNEFLNELLLECLTSFKILFEPLMHFNLNDKDLSPSKNFYLKNYLIFITHLFYFCFHYKHDLYIKNDFISFIPESSSLNNLLGVYISGMKFAKDKEKINESWNDYPFFDDIYKKLNVIWNKIKNFEYNKKSKDTKNQQILDKVILDKENKNLYQKELELLCYEEILNDKQVIIPLINIIPIGLMSIIATSRVISDFKYWLKELKKFIRFIIIGSSNLVRPNQLDLYNSIQDKCINVLSSCLCFLKDQYKTNNLCKEKVEKALQKIFSFCFLIVRYQYNYFDKHKGIKGMIFTKKLSRNDLVACAVFRLFVDLIKDSNGNSLLPQQKVEQLYLSKFNGVLYFINNEEWQNYFFENRKLKEKLTKKFFSLNEYKKIVDERFELLKVLTDENDEKYKKEILSILPNYEKELLKYSNNSLERNKRIKHVYKLIKKVSFSWQGFWSDRKLFYDKIDSMKMKMINHHTKTFMKPILVPILDISYYLPQFSGFDPKNLFNTEKNTTENKLIMDIDKILKITDKSARTDSARKVTVCNKNLKENFLRKIYNKSNPELASKLIKIADTLDFGKEEEFTIISSDKGSSNKIKNYLGCLVKTSHHIKGVCFVGEKSLNFKVFINQKTGNAMSDVEVGFTTEDDDYDQERKTCFGSYFICHPKDKDLYKISIDYSDIKWIFRRKYYYKNSAFEIYTQTNKSYYFNLKFEEDREKVLSEILGKLKDAVEIVDDMKSKDIYDNVIGYEYLSDFYDKDNRKKNMKKFKLSKKIDAWKDWEITNYEMLMWLNIFGNRSFNDISQYPVFPWVLTNYEEPLKKEFNGYDYREMALPMGMTELNPEGEKRKELFLETYDTLKSDPDSEIKPYIYGSNYSNPIYVCYYLIRLFPFTHISIELQGKKFDDANRLFLSVEKSFYNSTSQKTDVRELIPEFFYLPEMFLNINDLNLGVEENGNKVNDVITPCSPYDFVSTMKTVLESDFISYNIQNWIDLIFGSKSKGKEAENANNLFTEASYQENIDIKKIENKESYLRLVEFGLIPSQVMNKDCAKKDKKEGKEVTNPETTFIRFECKSNTDSPFYSIKEDFQILKVCENSSEKLTIIFNNGILIEKKISNIASFGKYFDEVSSFIKLPNFYNYMPEFYSSTTTNKKVIQFLNNNKTIVFGGFYDSKIAIINIQNNINPIYLYPFNDNSQILSVEVNKDEDYLFVGNSIGNVLVYKINIDIKKWIKFKLITNQMDPISHIHCNNNLNLWCSTSINGYINIYTLPLCRLVRSLKISTKKCSYSFLCDSPLPSIVIISDEVNSEIYVYSINGTLISKKMEYFHLTNPLIMKDSNSNDYLGYVGKDGFFILSIPDLNLIGGINSLPGVHSICLSNDKKTFYVLNKNASKVLVIKGENKINKNAGIRAFSVAY